LSRPAWWSGNGQQSDMPAALTEVGVVISSSVRESFHLGVVEGAASGAVPVVRDWPFFAGRKASARALFPAGWVVGSPAEAAERIRAATASEEVWRGRRPGRVRPGDQRLGLGRRPPGIDRVVLDAAEPMWPCPQDQQLKRDGTPAVRSYTFGCRRDDGRRTMTRRSMESTVGTEPVRPAPHRHARRQRGERRLAGAEDRRSAADAGWDVTLIGRSPNAPRRRGSWATPRSSWSGCRAR